MRAGKAPANGAQCWKAHDEIAEPIDLLHNDSTRRSDFPGRTMGSCALSECARYSGGIHEALPADDDFITPREGIKTAIDRVRGERSSTCADGLSSWRASS